MIQGNLDLTGIQKCYASGPGAEIPGPRCGKMFQFKNDPMWYPRAGKTDVIRFACKNCSNEFKMLIEIKSIVMAVEYDDLS